MCFFLILGVCLCVWGGLSPKGVVHELLFFAVGSTKNEVSETYFFDIVTTHDDHPSYAKHVLGSIYVCFTVFGYWELAGGGGGGIARGRSSARWICRRH